ncbi:MAG: FliH/SctL family protein [Magnetospirillum sp.]|nr:FliH/SctL family protein [Magnetospirillum sp.]
MANLRKFTFDLDFSSQPSHRKESGAAAEPQPAEPPPPPPTTFSEDELNLARESAFEEGRARGSMEAAASADGQVAKALTAMAAQMDDLARRQAEANDRAAREAVRVVFAATRKMFPAACEAHAFDEIIRMAEDMVGHVLDEPRIIVRVAEDLAEAVRSRLESLGAAHGFEGRILVQPTPGMPMGDCRIEWADGGAERDQARLQAEIDALVERALAQPEPRPANEARDDEQSLADKELADAGV